MQKKKERKKRQFDAFKKKIISKLEDVCIRENYEIADKPYYERDLYTNVLKNMHRFRIHLRGCIYI